MSARVSASASCSGPRFPGSARQRLITPTRAPPTCNGSANTARTPSPVAAGVNIGQRVVHSAAVRSPTRTGPSAPASAPGPSPRVRVRSSRSAAPRSLATRVSRAAEGSTTVTAAPSTPAAGITAAQTCPTVTGPPNARSTSRLHTRILRSVLIASPHPDTGVTIDKPAMAPDGPGECRGAKQVTQDKGRVERNWLLGRLVARQPTPHGPVPGRTPAPGVVGGPRAVRDHRAAGRRDGVG
jgi:hypothetical protein